MKIILAQGNPGAEYEKTRHNVGFLAIDYFAKKNGVDFQSKPKFFADVAELSIDNEKILLVKPTTFYNETGKSARALVDFYKVDTNNLLVIHDEIALPFGTLRTREKGRDAGNNGIKSLNAHLGENYWRLRVGTQNESLERMGSHDFVLSKFNGDEITKLSEDICPKIVELLNQFALDNIESISHSI